jgi:aminopeptidase
MTIDAATLARYADLIVGFGANVQPGQPVFLGSEVGKEDLTRAVVEACYRRDARFVDVEYFDPWTKRARLLGASAEALDYVPPWYGDRVRGLVKEGGAAIRLSGAVAPRLLADVDPALVGRDRLPNVPELTEAVIAGQLNWVIAGCPTPGWAELAHPDLPPLEATRRLWDEVLSACRVDEPDPVAAWEVRMGRLVEVAGRLTERRFDRILLDGPGTELSVGLLPSSTWRAATMTTIGGLVFHPNLPSEETFTTPDPERVDGVVRSTRPLQLGGTIVRGLEVRFEGGRAVAIEAEEGAEAMRARSGLDDGAARLGELALVDRHGRVGALETVFFDTLYDENAASHIALGAGMPDAVDAPDRERINRSEVHVDFMVGSEEVEVTGVTAAGERVPILRRGDWAL